MTEVSRRVGWVQVFRKGVRVQTYSVRRYEVYTSPWTKGVPPACGPVHVSLSYGGRWRLCRELMP